VVAPAPDPTGCSATRPTPVGPLRPLSNVPTYALPPGQANKLAVLLDALDGVALSEVRSRSGTSSASIDATCGLWAHEADVGRGDRGFINLCCG
jgi:hypothetical protein